MNGIKLKIIQLLIFKILIIGLISPTCLFAQEKGSSYRLRSLIAKGKYVSATRNAIIWNGWGFGQSSWGYKKTVDGNTFELNNITQDFSYTFGSEWSLTLGAGFNLSGKGTITSTSREYKTTKVTGNYNFAVLGIEFGIIEVLVGYRKDDFEYSEFSDSSTTLETKHKVSGGIMLTGLGLSF